VDGFVQLAVGLAVEVLQRELDLAALDAAHAVREELRGHAMGTRAVALAALRRLVQDLPSGDRRLVWFWFGGHVGIRGCG
jgi:hypothetical protein